MSQQPTNDAGEQPPKRGKSKPAPESHEPSKPKMGRPSRFTPQLADEIVERLATGEPLAKICRDDHMPCYSVVRKWEDEKPEFLALTTRGRKDGTHYMADECIEIADNPTIDHQHKRIMVDTRIRLIGKWNAKEYGDNSHVKVDQTTRVEPVSAEQMQDEMRQSPALRREIEAMLAKSKSDEA